MSRLRAIVVIPARDEEEHVGAALSAAVGQADAVGACFGVIVVDDRSTDRTAAVARDHIAAAAARGVPLRVLEGPGAGVGWARRTGLDAAARWAHGADGPDDRCLLVCTDADTIVDDRWLAVLLACADAGDVVIAGDVALDPRAAVDDAVLMRRRHAAAGRLAAVHEREPGAEHHHFAGANLAIALWAYDRIGGMPTSPALEDEALLDAVRRSGLPVRRTADAVVRTSPRTAGRAPRGLAVDLAVESWRAAHRHHHADFALADLPRDARVSVVVPARDVAETVGGVLSETVAPLRRAGIVDEVVVIDAASRDGTADVARSHGARVVQQDGIRSDVGPCRGKGDAMWRALQVVGGDVVAFLDGDTSDPSPAHLLGVLGPLLTDHRVAMVRGCFDRPRRGPGGAVEPHGGGRVTELTARPLLNLHFPLLSGFRQPLAGELAARRTLLEALPFPVGYGVEIATLIDAVERVGLDAVAEVDLGTRQNRHQDLRDLTPMAYAVLCAVERRIPRAGAISASMRLPWHDDVPRTVPIAERPPVVPPTPPLSDTEPGDRDALEVCP